MEFGVTGKATPRAYNRQIPGTSARGRPQSGKQSFNPITGEEMRTPTPRQQNRRMDESAPGKKSDIPSLNLHYLKDDDFLKGPAFDIDLNDYSLDSPGSVSTVSWGTARSSYGVKSQPPAKSSGRVKGVPGLDLGNTKPPSARKPTVKPKGAWDKDVIPSDLPAPSARHQQMYQQYANDLKESYRAHTEQNQKVKSNQKQVKNGSADSNDECAQDTIKDSWTRQKYTGKQLLKKIDAEDMLEHNKKQKMVETVMIDQLSRAVISDPQQDARSSYRYATGRERGSNRFLHDSRIKTSSTATENLLSRRVRFDARILTRNAKDAMRELTGFYFEHDKTMTVYEFRKLGKSAKAMPFIYRGQYQYLSGPKQGKPYSLSDIYSGSNLKIPTTGQLALTDNLAESDTIVIRVVDVDESEKESLLDTMDYEDGERDHAPSKLDIERRDFLFSVQEEVSRQVCKRGIKVVTGLGRLYRRMDQYNTGILDQFDLEKGIKSFRINIDPDTLDEVFEILDPTGNKLLDYVEYMHGILGEMSEYRKAFVRKAFKKLSSGNKGMIHVSDVKKFFNGNIRESDPGVSALQAFLEAVKEDGKNENISFTEFEEYYEGLSLGVETDEDFANILRNTWNV